MSVLSAAEAALSNAEADVHRLIRDVMGKARLDLEAEVAQLHVDEQKLGDDVKAALSAAKASILAGAQKADPASASAVGQALNAIEQAVLAAVLKHVAL